MDETKRCKTELETQIVIFGREKAKLEQKMTKIEQDASEVKYIIHFVLLASTAFQTLL